MPAKIAYVLPVLKLSRKQRRLGNKMYALAKACVSWLHYGWRALSNAKFLRVAAAALAFAGTLAVSAPAQAAMPAAGSFRVNQTTSGWQGDPAVATDADGDTVVVWLDSGYGPFNELMARRYTRNGLPNGPEFPVVGGFVADVQPDVAMDAEGNFVVVWGGLNDQIWAQRFTADGSRNGRLFQVSQSDISNDGDGPAVALDADGNFVVTWESYQVEHPSTSYSPGFGVGIAARVFDSKGDAVTDELCVNSTVLDDQDSPAVAIDRDGDFVIVWEGFYNGSDNDVFGQRFNAAGQRVGLEFRVNEFDNDDQGEADVAMDADGNFVVVWNSVYFSSPSQSWSSADHNVMMRRYDAQGNALDGEQFVAQGDGDNSDYNYDPSVSMDADGNFVIAWSHGYSVYNSFSQFSSYYSTIQMQTFFADGSASDVPRRVNDPSYDQWSPDVAMDAEGDFVVVREGFGPGDTNGPGVFGRLYVETTDVARPVVGGVYTQGADERLYEGERLAHRPWSLVVALSEDMNSADIENSSNWELWHNGVDVTAWVDSVDFGWNSDTSRYEALVSFANALKDGSYTLTLDGSVRDAAGNSMGSDFNLGFSVWKTVALGTDRITNDGFSNPAVQGFSGPSSGSVGNTAVAMDADGNFIIAWVEEYSSYVGNTGYPSYFPIFDNVMDIFIRRYNADGTPKGEPLNITETFSRNEFDPQIAMDDEGNFVIAFAEYYSYSGSNGQNVMVRRYDADDNEIGGEIQTSIFGRQRNPSLAMDKDGDFVVAWSSQAFGGDQEVFLKGWRWNGNALPGTNNPVFVSNNGTYDDNPSVDVDDDGDFVVVWEAERWHSSSSSWNTDIVARRYDNQGFFRAQFDIANDPTAHEWAPAIALDHDGDFVVAWNKDILVSNDNGPFTSYSWADHVFARSFNAFGEARTDEQQVSQPNTSPYPGFSFNWSLNHGAPSIAMDNDGEFVVTWGFNDWYSFFDSYQSQYSYDIDSISGGVLARRFDAGATAQGDQFMVQSTLDGLSYGTPTPGIAMDSDGDFVVVWLGYAEQRDYYVSSSGYYISVSSSYDYGVVHRRFGRNEAPIAATNLNWYAQEDGGTDWVDLDDLFHDSTDGVEGLSFSIVSNSNPALVTASIDDNLSDDPDVRLQYEPDAHGQADVVVRCTDQDGKWTERTLHVTVDPVNDAPVLDDSGSPQLTDVLEDSTNPAGNTVASIIGSSITDVDGDTVGIAIFAADNADGQWQYNVGAGWVNFPAVDTDNSLVLGPANSVRFIPDPAFTGSATFDYRGWDQTDSATAGTTVDVDSVGTGGTTPYSDDTETATVNVNNSNDAPTLTGPGSLSDIDEDETDPAGDDIASIVGTTINDVDPGALEGIAVTAADTTNGVWEYSIDGGSNWMALPDVAADDALLLTPADMLRFIPNADFEGTATVTYRAWDQTSGSAGDQVDTTVNGGQTAFSTTTQTGTVTVNPVNDAPVLDNGGNPLIGTITNTDADPAGVEIADLLGTMITDIDAGDPQGVAIVGITGATAGVWQYSTDSGASWNDFPAVSTGAALLLADDNMVRYIAGAGFVGTATVSFHAWDQSTGSAGGTADLSGVGATGGTTAFSVDFETARVIVVAGVPGDSGGDDDSGCVANTGTQGAAFGLLALMLALMASLRGLVGRRSE